MTISAMVPGAGVSLYSVPAGAHALYPAIVLTGEPHLRSGFRSPEQSCFLSGQLTYTEFLEEL